MVAFWLRSEWSLQILSIYTVFAIMNLKWLESLWFIVNRILFSSVSFGGLESVMMEILRWTCVV